MIVIGVTGSIAAYKSIELAKLLIENGFEIKIILSASAADFVSPLTLRSLFPGKVYLYNDDLEENDEMLHINLAKAAEMILIAPASANIIGKIANGLADCLLSTICLASEAPILLAPAMNKVMWENKFVQDNISKFNYIIGPSSGIQACGDIGFGRMSEPHEILEYIKNFNIKKIFNNQKIIITAGPTHEKIDPVRYISNYGSGKMGYALAKIANKMGAEVTLISGPTILEAPIGVNLIKVESSNEMYEASIEAAKNCDIFIGAAAVADYSLIEYSKQKIKKTDKNLNLILKENLDIIASIKKKYQDIFVVGFAAETNDFLKYGLAKLESKNLDMIAINDVSNGKVFGKDYNELHVITKGKDENIIPKNTKDQVAKELLELISKYLA